MFLLCINFCCYVLIYPKEPLWVKHLKKKMVQNIVLCPRQFIVLDIHIEYLLLFLLTGSVKKIITKIRNVKIDKLLRTLLTTHYIHLMSVRSWSFFLDPKKQGFCSKINCIQMKLLYFVNWHSARASKSAEIVLSKPIFYVKNQPNFFEKKNHLRISI